MNSSPSSTAPLLRFYHNRWWWKIKRMLNGNLESWKAYHFIVSVSLTSLCVCVSMWITPFSLSLINFYLSLLSALPSLPPSFLLSHLFDISRFAQINFLIALLNVHSLTHTGSPPLLIVLFNAHFEHKSTEQVFRVHNLMKTIWARMEMENSLRMIRETRARERERAEWPLCGVFAAVVALRQVLLLLRSGKFVASNLWWLATAVCLGCPPRTRNKIRAIHALTI